MIFDEQKFFSLLTNIDLTSSKIKQISNYMLNHIDNSQSIVKIWKNYFLYSKSGDVHLALIYLCHDIMYQSYLKKNDKYIVRFGDILEEVFHFSSKAFGNDLDTINIFLKLIDFWSEKMYFSQNFIKQLRNIINQQKDIIYKNDPGIKLNEDINKELVNRITNNEFTKKTLELNIEEKNIKNIYDNINFEKLNNILLENDTTNPIRLEQNKKIVDEYEEQIKSFKEILLNDLIKREKLINSYSENLHKEKELFFNGFDNKKNKDEKKE